jgi:hypothetical protein
MEGRLVNKIEKQACFGGDCRPVPIFLPIKFQKQVVDRVGDNQRSEPPRPNKPSPEDQSNNDRCARPEKSKMDMVTSKKER